MDQKPFPKCGLTAITVQMKCTATSTDNAAKREMRSVRLQEDIVAVAERCSYKTEVAGVGDVHSIDFAQAPPVQAQKTMAGILILYTAMCAQRQMVPIPTTTFSRQHPQRVVLSPPVVSRGSCDSCSCWLLNASARTAAIQAPNDTATV